MWGPAWIEIHWNNIWLRAQSHMTTSHYTWESVTTLHDFKGVLGQPLEIFFWALTISWSRLLACVWSDPCCGGLWLWFTFFGSCSMKKGSTNANHIPNYSLPHHPLFHVIIHIQGRCSCSCGITKELQDQGLGRRLRRQPLSNYNPTPTRIMIITSISS